MNELEYFRRIAGDNPFRAWVDAQRVEAIKYLTSAVDTVQIHRAQGKIQLLDRLIENLEKSKNLR